MEGISEFIQENKVLIGVVIGIILSQAISYAKKEGIKKDTAVATKVWEVERTAVKGWLPVFLFAMFFALCMAFASAPMSTTKVQAVVLIVVTGVVIILAVYLYQFFKQPDTLVFADDNLILCKGMTTKKYHLGSLTRMEAEKRENTVVTLYNSVGKQVAKLCVDDYEYPDKLLEHLRTISSSKHQV